MAIIKKIIDEYVLELNCTRRFFNCSNIKNIEIYTEYLFRISNTIKKNKILYVCDKKVTNKRGKQKIKD